MAVDPTTRKSWARNIWQSKIPATETHANYHVHESVLDIPYIVGAIVIRVSVHSEVMQQNKFSSTVQ